jgi:curved DNA-binding protein CbpA
MEPQDRERLLAWDDVLDDANYYEILGLLEIADEDAVRKAFRQFSLAFHPDAHPEAEAEIEQRLRRLFQRGAEAYRVLVDPTLRAEYDLALAKGQTRLGVRAAAAATGVKSLDDLCRSASGKLHAREADRLISTGDLAGAKRRLLQAIRCEVDPDPELDVRLDALDLALFAQGS